MIRTTFFALAAVCLASTAASAAPVYFSLGDHPAAGSSRWGLLLSYEDESLGLGPQTRFSAGDNRGGGGGPLYLTWDDEDPDAGASMFGQIFNPADDTFWQVQYDFFGVSLAPGGGFFASSGNGTLTRGDDLIHLRSKQADFFGVETGVAFLFTNLGYRLPEPPGWAGAGWLVVWSPSLDTWVSAGENDWLLTGVRLDGAPLGEEIPEPATVTLMLTGLGALILRRRFAGKA